MIVRILGIGQFKLDDRHIDSLNKIDNQIVEHVSKGREKEFRKDLAKIISMIQEKGEAMDPAEIVPSDIIVPPADMTLDEAKQVFSGEGLIKG
ncbi:MAG TPA: hypothetical protein PKY20_07425 [Methanothrix sp.]|nr:hypothetical protein [Methanothrix sp.]